MANRVETKASPMPEVKQKLYAIGWQSSFDDKDHPEYAFTDRELLSRRDPLTQAEIDYVNLQLTDAMRKLARDAGVSEQDAEKIEMRYWYEKKSSYQNGNHVWGAFYDCDQTNFEDGDVAHAPYEVSDFLREFEHAMRNVNFEPSNTETIEKGGRQAVGWSQKGWHGNSAYMRGGSRDILLPMVRLFELMDPTFKLHFDVPELTHPEPVTTSHLWDGCSDRTLEVLVETDKRLKAGMEKALANGLPPFPDSLAYDGVQEEWQRRAPQRDRLRLQERLDRSRANAQLEARPQSLSERLRIAMSNERIRAVDPNEPYDDRGR